MSRCKVGTARIGIACLFIHLDLHPGKNKGCHKVYLTMEKNIAVQACHRRIT